MQKLNIKSELDFVSVCRTCLEQKDEGTNYIFDIESETNMSFLDMLSTFIKMQFNNKLPQKICATCINCIKNAYTFKCQVEQNEKLLLDYLKKDEIIDDRTENIKVDNETPLTYEPTCGIFIKSEIPEYKESNIIDANEEDINDAHSDNVYSDDTDIDLQKEIFPIETLLNSFNKKDMKTPKKEIIQKKSIKIDKNDDNTFNDQIDVTNFKPTDVVNQTFEYLYSNINELESTRNIGTLDIQNSSNLSPDKNKVRKKREKNEFKIDLHNFVCEICHKTFNIQSRLKKHMVKHDPDNKKFECSVCHKKFTQRDNMKTHIKKFHDKTYVPKPTKYEDKQLCIYCGKKVAGIVVHMRRHTGERPFKCETCGRAFPRVTELRYHQRSHTGERPYLCTVCGKGFAKSHKLKNHIRIHTGERPYKCTYCDQAFIQSKDLKHHVRRHTGEKPHECGDCGKRFIQKTALRTHCKLKGHSYAKGICHEVVKNERIIQPIQLMQ